MPGGVWIDKTQKLILKKIAEETRNDRVLDIHDSLKITSNADKLLQVSQITGVNRILELGAKELVTLNLPRDILQSYLTESFQVAGRFTCSKLDFLLKKDGLIPIDDYSQHPPGHLIVAFSQRDDYHFLRLEGDRWWECSVNRGISRRVEGIKIPPANEACAYFNLDPQLFIFEGYYIVPVELVVKDSKGRPQKKEGLKFSFSRGEILGNTRGDCAFYEEKLLRFNPINM